MESKRPGHASVQYGDLRGESAADIADEMGNLNSAARNLGFTVAGTVLGIRMFGSPILADKVHVTIQVFKGGSWKEINSAADSAGGKIRVNEHTMEVPLSKFMECFKRLNVSLFDAHLPEVRALEVIETA